MPFNGSGVFQRVRSWVADAAAGIKIRADYHDAEDDGFAAGLTNCITKDGQTVVSQNIPFNNKRITGLADPVNPQDAATKASIPGLITGVALPITGGTITGDLTVSGTVNATTINVTTINTSTLTATGKITAAGGSTGDISDATGSAAFEVQSATGGASDAYMSFHRPGAYAVNFGLNDDGNLYVGGWSMGAVKHRILTTKDIPDTTQLFPGIPMNPQGNYTTIATDAQKCIVGTGGVTINAALYPIGAVITFVAFAGAMTIANTTTMYWVNPSGAPIPGNRSLADRGIATAVKIHDGSWVIGGNGLT